MRLPLLSLSLLTTMLVACGGEPPTPDEVRTALREDLAPILREGQAATDATANLPTGAAFGFATAALGGADGAALRLVAPLAERVAGPRDRNLSLDGEEETTIDTDAIVDQLEQELFTDANYLGNGIYRVPASLVCETSTYDETTGETLTSIDPECAQQLEDAQLRIRVTDEDDAIRFFVQIDANHDEPLSFLLGKKTLAITVNLDDATDAMVALAAIAGEQAPNAELAGQVTGSLDILGAAHARVALTIDRAISIKFADQGQSLDGDGAFRVTSAAGEIVGVELDANAAQGSFDLGLGATTVHVPGSELDPTSTDIDLGGLTVNASLQGHTLHLDNLSLGEKTTTVSVGGQQGLAIDLNPADGRALDATITVDPATGDETFEVSPRLDLHTTVDHAVLGDEAPVYDVTRVQLDGALRGTALGQVEVLSGSVSVTTNPAQYGFSATAGQCVHATENYDDTTYTSYTTYSVGACL